MGTSSCAIFPDDINVFDRAPVRNRQEIIPNSAQETASIHMYVLVFVAFNRNLKEWYSKYCFYIQMKMLVEKELERTIYTVIYACACVS